MTRGHYELVFLSVPMIVAAFVFADHFKTVGLGRDVSRNLGGNYYLVLFSGLAIAAVITASVVSTATTTFDHLQKYVTDENIANSATSSRQISRPSLRAIPTTSSFWSAIRLSGLKVPSSPLMS